MSTIVLNMHKVDLFKEPTPLVDLERYYDKIIDVQFWFEAEYSRIRNISQFKHTVIYNIYFNPIMLAQLSILDSFNIPRRVELAKLIDLLTTLYKIHYGEKTDLFHGLPPMREFSHIPIRPRTRLPVNIPPPPSSLVPYVRDSCPLPIFRQPPNYYYTTYSQYLFKDLNHEQ